MNVQFKNSRPAIKWMSQRALTKRSVEILRKEHHRILKDGDEVCGARVIVDDVHIICSAFAGKRSGRGRWQELITTWKAHGGSF